MITEDYISFETAKLLAKKSFDYCAEYESYYTLDGTIVYFKDIPQEVNIAPRITLQMAMKWLREIHELHIMVNCIGKVNYDPIVQRFDGKDFEIEGVEVGTTRRINGKWENVRRGFKTYEEACEAAIKYCLENLI